MRWPGRTIWDTRIQGVCGILSAAGGLGPEIYGSATFAQITLRPPRVIVNPNRMYPIEPAIQHSQRFAINVLAATQADRMVRLMRLRRRQPRKPAVLDIHLARDHHD